MNPNSAEPSQGSQEPASRETPTVRLPSSVVHEYRRFSLYNSPYPAHDRGCAIDLYPDGNRGLSPVAGEVLETRTVRAPPKPYAADEEFLILVDVDIDRTGLRVDWSADTVGYSHVTDSDTPGCRKSSRSCRQQYEEGVVARILHVRPRVSPGDTVAVGDPLGPMVRSGFFAPWVGNHVHVGFRRSGQNLLRAGGSLPLEADVDVEPLAWDGVGTVTETGDTYALLDSPTHPAPGERFAGIAGQLSGETGAVGLPDSGGTSVALDGGLTHYTGGGLPGQAVGTGSDRSEPVTFLGHSIGDAIGRNVAWHDIDVLANGDRITGLSLFAARDPEFGAKLVCPDREFSVGSEVRVTVRESDDPIRLG